MGNFLSGLVNNAVGFAPYAAKALRENDAVNMQKAAVQLAQQRQQRQDNLNEAFKHAQMDAMGDEAVQYIKDDNGTYVAVPKKLHASQMQSYAQPAQAPSPAQAPTQPSPSFALPSTADLAGALRGGPSADPQQGSAPPQQTTPKPPAQPAQVLPPKPLGIPTGIKAPPPKPVVAPRIDPNSQAGISADSAKTANRRQIMVANPLPTRPGAAPKIDPNSQAGITADSIKAANRASFRPGGMTGGMGSGGLGGLARTSGAITELGTADDMLTQYEQNVRAGKASFNGLDYYQGQIAKMYDDHGKVNQAVHAAVFANLNKINPDLANYIRAAEMFALADGAISGKTSDFRTKLDGFVSSIGPNAGPAQIDNTQRGRKTRLEALKKFQPAMEAAANRFLPGGGRGNAPPPNVPSPDGPTGPVGDFKLDGTASPLRQKYDKAAAHLKAQGKSDADILKAIGTPPESE